MPKPYPRPSKDAWAGDIAVLCLSGLELPDLPGEKEGRPGLPYVRLDALYETIFLGLKKAGSAEILLE